MAVVDWKLEQYNGHFVFPTPAGASLFARSPGGKRVHIWLEWTEALKLCKELEELYEGAKLVKMQRELDELVKAELEAHPEKYFSVFQEDEENQVWVPIDEVYDAVMRARHEVKENAGY